MLVNVSRPRFLSFLQLTLTCSLMKRRRKLTDHILHQCGEKIKSWIFLHKRGLYTARNALRAAGVFPETHTLWRYATKALAVLVRMMAHMLLPFLLSITCWRFALFWLVNSGDLPILRLRHQPNASGITYYQVPYRPRHGSQSKNQ